MATGACSRRGELLSRSLGVCPSQMGGWASSLLSRPTRRRCRNRPTNSTCSLTLTTRRRRRRTPARRRRDLRLLRICMVILRVSLPKDTVLAVLAVAGNLWRSVRPLSGCTTSARYYPFLSCRRRTPRFLILGLSALESEVTDRPFPQPCLSVACSFPAEGAEL